MADMLVNSIVFLGKPDGGVRPIGLLPLLFKIYSRVRQPLCRAWEQAHPCSAFWGGGSKSCERAGW
eukprot:9490160-Pyramimonas_sp.AAC.1